MPTGPRVRANSVFGTTNDDPLTSGATTFNSNQLVLLPVISAQHAVITLDPIRQYGDPEIVVVTAHTAASSIATISRATYGTTARSHPLGTVWAHSLVTEDMIQIVTSGTRPTDPYRGQKIFETDTEQLITRSMGDAWSQDGLFFNPPACRVFNSTNFAITNGGSEQVVTYNSERYDTDNMHSTSVNTSRIVFNTAGLYIVTATFNYAGNVTGDRVCAIRLNGTTFIAYTAIRARSVANGTVITATGTYKFAASDYVESLGFQDSGGSLNITAAGNYSPEFSATWIGRGQ